MRYITIPASVELQDLMTDASSGRMYTFKEFLGQMLLDPRFGKTSADVFVSADIRQRFKETGGEPGRVLELSDGEWERLSSVIKEPTNPYAPVIVVQVADFLRCILDATTKKPE
jgi:hypothetical protein